MIPTSQIHEFIAANGNFIFEIVKRPNCYIVKLLRSVNSNYNIPQFGVQVLSESRSRMDSIIDYCNRNSIPIYSIKTDSFVIPTKNIQQLEAVNKIGTELGEFKIEYQAVHTKYTSASCYKAELIDGNVRMRGIVN